METMDTIQPSGRMSGEEMELNHISSSSQNNTSHDSQVLESLFKVLTLFSASSILMIAVGVPNTFGVFQSYFERGLFSNIPPSQILLIGSLASTLYMTLGVFMGRLADLWGHEKSLALGSLLMVSSLFIASVSTEFYQIALTQGVMFGLGASSAYYPSVTISRRLFARHGLANAIVVSGGAVGGCILPYPIRLLLLRYGLAETYRTIGYISAGVLFPANIILYSNCKSVTKLVLGKNNGKIMDLGLLRDTRFIIMLVASSIAMIGFLPRYFLITPSAIAMGVDSSFAAWLLALMNGLSILGRLGIGSFADRFGKLSALILSFVLCGIGHLTFWLPGVMFGGEKSIALLTTFVVFVGLFGSGFVSLIPVVTSDVFGPEQIASKIGLLNTAIGLGAFAGPSVAYAIVNKDQNWGMSVLFSGLLMIFGGLGLTTMKRYL